MFDTRDKCDTVMMKDVYEEDTEDSEEEIRKDFYHRLVVWLEGGSSTRIAWTDGFLIRLRTKANKPED